MLQFFDNLTVLSGKLEVILQESSSIFLLTDENVSENCLPQLIAACPVLEKAEVIEIEPGEFSKTHDIVIHLWQHLLDCGADRKSALINLGGGVVTDLGGFVASTYKRGIKTVHIPTSLLAMVDAAIGGKTGIDFGGIKNSIGTFYLGDVLIYPPFAQTLPAKEILSGFGEILKTALISDAELSSQLMKMKKLELNTLIEFIPTCAFIKQSIVTEDLHESGNRKLLNLGHTIGHAVEAAWLESGILKPHGVCVAIGIIVETRIACQKSLCMPQVLTDMEDFIVNLFDLKNIVLPDFQSLMKTILQDKKNSGGKIKMVMLTRPGKAVFDVSVEASEIDEAWAYLQRQLSA